MAHQIMDIELSSSNKGIIHDLIRLPENASKELFTSALHRSIEKAYRIFLLELREKLVNDKKKNWKALNLEYFDDIAELLRQRNAWASCESH
jgi:hypothetical protein